MSICPLIQECGKYKQYCCNNHIIFSNLVHLGWVVTRYASIIYCIYNKIVLTVVNLTKNTILSYLKTILCSLVESCAVLSNLVASCRILSHLVESCGNLSNLVVNRRTPSCPSTIWENHQQVRVVGAGQNVPKQKHTHFKESQNVPTRSQNVPCWKSKRTHIESQNVPM